MAYTQYSQAWLEDPSSIRSIFIVATVLYDSSGTGTSYVSTPLYFSSDGLLTSDGLISFNPIITGTVGLTESISQDGGISMAFGDISLVNKNGELDTYFDVNRYIWANQSIQVYYGDPSWAASSTDFTTSTTKFKLIFNGVIDDIDSRSYTEATIKVRDKLEKLNNPLTEDKLGTAVGTWVNAAQNADSIKPLVFGEVFNMTPLLMDPNNGGGRYMVNDGPISELIEIRDNGVPIYQAGNSVFTGATVDIATGTFILTYPPVGAITASVKGTTDSINLSTGALVTASYSNTIAKLVALIVTQHGPSNSRLVAADLDLVNLAAFDTANPDPVGVVITDRENILNVCQSLASSVGAQLYFTKEGKLQLLQYGIGVTPAADPTITVGVTAPVTDSDIIFNSISVAGKIPMLGACKIGYCKNWTVQEGLLTSIPADHKDLYADEWLSVTVNQNATKVTNFKLNVDPPQLDTLLLTTADATAEATRLVTFYNIPRVIYKFTGTPRLLSLRLGQQIYLAHSRFNLYNAGAGVLGQVVTLSPNWTTGYIDVEVLI